MRRRCPGADHCRTPPCWGNPRLWLYLIVIGCLLVAAFFVARVMGL
ncbi:hypothetical protein ACFZDI_10545 [Streptomyces sp. NPDC007907]